MSDFNLKEHGRQVVSKSHWLSLSLSLGAAFIITLFYQLPSAKMMIIALAVSAILASISVYSWCKNGSSLQVLMFVLFPITIRAFENSGLIDAVQYVALVLALMSLYILLFKRHIYRLLNR